jgi:uncharacterized protein DUF6022
MPLGTLVTCVFHDHTRFRIPHPPGTIALEETETPAILEALSHASVRLRGRQQEREIEQTTTTEAQQPGWEYSVEVGLADCLDAQRVEISESLLDHALSLWGRYGWELVAVVPQQERMIAFFKRRYIPG